MRETKLTIRAARINAGLTQQEVQARTGIARSTLTRWESGETAPSKRHRKLLCELYKTDAECIQWEKV